jgi:hypothetical protein
VFVCSARDRKGLQSGKRSLFSKTRPSRAVPFPTISPNILLKNKLFLLSPLRSKRATLYIHPHGRVRCFGAAKPGRRDQSRRVFAFGPFCHTDTHTTDYSKPHTTDVIPAKTLNPTHFSRLKARSPWGIRLARVPQQLRQYCLTCFEMLNLASSGIRI